MKARVIAAFTSKAGDHVPGDIVEGDIAIRLLTAGYAEPIKVSEKRTADVKPKLETASKD